MLCFRLENRVAADHLVKSYTTKHFFGWTKHQIKSCLPLPVFHLLEKLSSADSELECRVGRLNLQQCKTTKTGSSLPHQVPHSQISSSSPCCPESFVPARHNRLRKQKIKIKMKHLHYLHTITASKWFR